MWDLDEIRFFRLGGKVSLGTEAFLLSLVFFVFFFFETVSCYVTLSDLELRMSFLPQSAR